MPVSAIQEQRDIIVATIRNITRGNWKILVVDATSRKLLDNSVAEDDILNQNVANIEVLEERREMSPDIEAIYFLTPEPHIVDSVVADLDRGRYRSGYLLWTSLLDPPLRRRIDSSPVIRKVSGFETLPLNFFPRESNLITFRDPWSFPVLYHPACNNLVADHMRSLAQKIVNVCATLGELPTVRYYSPRNATHEASVLSQYLAKFVSDELESYARYNSSFPPQTARPQSVLLVTDRSMDLMSPLVHEFTYQAMAHDLLPIDDREKPMYRMSVNDGAGPAAPGAQDKEVPLLDSDRVWVDNRHRHMKDTIDKLMGDFQKFLDKNPHFAAAAAEGGDTSGAATNLNTIRDMLAGLPQFQEMKEIYSLHLTMAQDCMNKFQQHKLPDIASVEQTLATGLDEDYRRPKNILEEVVRLLDDPDITPPDRLRLIIIYSLYRGGMVLEDIKRLLAHASLPPRDADIIANLSLLGARPTISSLKDPRAKPEVLFPAAASAAPVNEEYALSRFEPVLKYALEELCKGTLDQGTFPYVTPPRPEDDMAASQGGSLRAGRPNWAAAGRRAPENRQRVFVFVAGGATFSESRACYDVGSKLGRDIFLVSSHMLNPALFLRQVGDLSVDRRRLDLPLDRPRKSVPAHLLERPAPPAPVPAPPQQQQQQYQQQGGSMGMGQPGGGGAGRVQRPPPSGGLPGRPVAPPTNAMANLSVGPASGGSERPVTPSADASGGQKKGKLEKKRRNFLGMKK